MSTNLRIESALKLASDTKVVEIGENILGVVPQIFNELFANRNAMIVADKNTWRAAGNEVCNAMETAKIPTLTHIFPFDEFHADIEFVNELESAIRDSNAILIAVGAGVINDLCKLASERCKQHYICVATAASVDGFSSFGAPMLVNGEKVNLPCAAPIAIIADTNVLAEAPRHLTAAGYGDLASKVTAGAEWMIADLFGTEPITPDAWHVLYDHLNDYLANPKGIASGDKRAIAFLFEGLTMSGIAMQIAQSSRPASCTEHLYNHALEMLHHTHNGKIVSHGFQVAIGTLTLSALFDELLKKDLSKLDVDKCIAAWPTLEQEQQRALDLFKDFPAPRLGYEEITKKYNTPEQVRIQLTRVKENWAEFRTKIAGQVYTYQRMKSLFEQAGAPTAPEQIGIDCAFLRRYTDLTQLMRWRINLLDLAKRGCFYDELIDGTFGKGGVLEA